MLQTCFVINLCPRVWLIKRDSESDNITGSNKGQQQCRGDQGGTILLAQRNLRPGYDLPLTEGPH